MLIQWNETLSVKVQEIDNQHRKLINLINNLDEAMRKGKGKEVLGTVLNELVQYTKQHFAYEQGLMATYHYPDAEAHAHKHDTLTRQVFELHVKYMAGQASLTIPTMSFLNSWLIDHIQNTDKKFGDYLNSKGVL